MVVIRKQGLVIDVQDFSALDYCCRVCDEHVPAFSLALVVHKANNSNQVFRNFFRYDLLQQFLVILDEVFLFEECAAAVACDCSFRKDYNIRAFSFSFADALHDMVGVPCQVSSYRICLRKRDSYICHAYSSSIFSSSPTVVSLAPFCCHAAITGSKGKLGSSLIASTGTYTSICLSSSPCTA